MGNRVINKNQNYCAIFIVGMMFGMISLIWTNRFNPNPTFKQCVMILKDFDNRLEVCELLEGKL